MSIQSTFSSDKWDLVYKYVSDYYSEAFEVSPFYQAAKTLDSVDIEFIKIAVNS